MKTLYLDYKPQYVRVAVVDDNNELDDMTLYALGLIPVRGHARSFRFRREEPRPGRRYHLCPTAQASPTPSREQLELFTQAGWDFLLDVSASLAHFYLFCTDDPAAPEPSVKAVAAGAITGTS